MLPGERPDGEERPVEEARVERDERNERAVREPVFEEPEVGEQLFPLELGRFVLMSLSNATNSGIEIWGAFSRSVWLQWCLMTSQESVMWNSRWRYLPIREASSSEWCSVSSLPKSSKSGRV